jgi:hypothetical protein
MDDTLSDSSKSSAVESSSVESVEEIDSGEYTESLGPCTTPELSEGDAPRAEKKKRAREREMLRRSKDAAQLALEALEALRARKRQRKLTRGTECRGCGVCMQQ